MAVSQKIRSVLCMPLAVLILSQQLLLTPQVIASEVPTGVVRPLIEAEHAQAIYRHLVENHWTPRTGLFRCFPDSGDLKLSQQASTYEQAAMGLLSLRFGDTERVQSLFDFFKRTWEAGAESSGPHAGRRGLANFYNADFGSEGLEKTIHMGPNAWVGLFCAKLANTTKNAQALQLALDLQYWIANVLPHNNGGVAMGQSDDAFGAPWSRIYSTENNLSYYAFLTELLRSPVIEKAQRVAITQERDRVENWLVKAAFDSRRGVMLRGLNPEGRDPMGVLDTQTWLISVIGPKRLAARGIDPFLVMQNAEKTFEVTVGGHAGVDAADQLEANRVYTELGGHPEEINRPAGDGHRLIWYEGLGQYILAWSTLAEYARQIGDSGRP